MSKKNSYKGKSSTAKVFTGLKHIYLTISSGQQGQDFEMGCPYLLEISKRVSKLFIYNTFTCK